MHYDSRGDSGVLRRRALDPTLLVSRRHYALPVPGRGTRAFHSTVRLSGFGATGFGATGLQVAQTSIATAKIGAAAGSGVASAIGAGAAAGSFVPIIGTAIGALVGLVISGVFEHRTDPEVGNLNAANAAWRQNPNNLYNIADKYLVLAGFFDLTSGQLHGNFPLYRKYGRMGEGAFVNDMCAVIRQAAASGQITANDTPASVYSRIIVPWMSSWGLGTLNDPLNPGFLDTLITGLIAEYVTGLQNRWVGVDGSNFSNMPPFSLPTSALPAPAPAISPVIAPTVATPSVTIPSPTPQQIVSQIPAFGTVLSYVPDMAQNGLPVVPPGGATFVGRDPNNGSWVFQFPSFGGQWVMIQGRLTPYTPTLFGSPVTALLPPTASNVPAIISAAQNTATIQPLTTTSAGVGASYNPVYGNVAASGQSAASAQPVAAGTGGGFQFDSNTLLLIGSLLALSFALARPAKK